ncbi:hypothetical protein AAG906_029060 [Vitis piasezkii]
MSGPYGGALFSATAYNANDSILVMVLGKAKIVVGNKEVIIISDRHHALLHSVHEVFGIENHAYCYRHLKENFSSFLSKHNTRGNKGKENALQFLDSIACGRLKHDYNVSMVELKKYNEALATWVEENVPHHWAMSKFPKQRWDKMTTNLAESFNAWFWIERHHSICNFYWSTCPKSKNWKGCIGPKLKLRCRKILQRVRCIQSHRSRMEYLGYVSGEPC